MRSHRMQAVAFAMLVALSAGVSMPALADADAPLNVQRIGDGPIIFPELDLSIGRNIQGPSLVAVPKWVKNRLGNYYLYFADHKGSYIRMAYADKLTGPWKIHVPGSLGLKDSGFPTKAVPVTQAQMDQFAKRMKDMGISFSHDLMLEMTMPHVASPDVRVDEVNKRFVMTYHGLEGAAVQYSRVATSKNGIDFKGLPENIGPSYIRTFAHQGWIYGMAMPGVLLRSRDGVTNWERGPTLFDIRQRHVGLLKRDNQLYIFWSQVGDAPETILLSTMDISRDWTSWTPSKGQTVLKPEFAWEGANEPVVPSVRSTAYGLVNQLRDPAIFEENGRIYLLYAVGGESGIALAEVTLHQGGK